jgi:hypothetical protein
LPFPFLLLLGADDVAGGDGSGERYIKIYIYRKRAYHYSSILINK